MNIPHIPQVSLKPICKKDLPYLWKTYITALQQHIETIWGWDEKWQKSDFLKSLADYQTSILVCEGISIGYIQFKLNNEDLYINMIILQAGHQNKGIGAKLLASIQTEQARNTIKLKCFKVNKAAYRFYLRNGFEVISEDEYSYLLSRTGS
ncbi:MAG: GNAT family N-acetyltransferase [Proteobacteria bacterium]|nr:GNAT family N-acetyltransferase [Pseudomonadota bacterium]